MLAGGGRNFVIKSNQQAIYKKRYKMLLIENMQIKPDRTIGQFNMIFCSEQLLRPS